MENKRYSHFFHIFITHNLKLFVKDSLNSVDQGRLSKHLFQLCLFIYRILLSIQLLCLQIWLKQQLPSAIASLIFSFQHVFLYSAPYIHHFSFLQAVKVFIMQTISFLQALIQESDYSVRYSGIFLCGPNKDVDLNSFRKILQEGPLGSEYLFDPIWNKICLQCRMEMSIILS